MHGIDELIDNTAAAKILADHGMAVELLPSIAENDAVLRMKLLPDVFGLKNPDIRINSTYIGDIKTPSRKVSIRKSTISRCIYQCARQKVSIALINLNGRDYTIQDIKKGIRGALQPDRNRSIEAVWIITRETKVFKISRAEVFDESIYLSLNRL